MGFKLLIQDFFIDYRNTALFRYWRDECCFLCRFHHLYMLCLSKRVSHYWTENTRSACLSLRLMWPLLLILYHFIQSSRPCACNHSAKNLILAVLQRVVTEPKILAIGGIFHREVRILIETCHILKVIHLNLILWLGQHMKNVHTSWQCIDDNEVFHVPYKFQLDSTSFHFNEVEWALH